MSLAVNEPELVCEMERSGLDYILLYIHIQYRLQYQTSQAEASQLEPFPSGQGGCLHVGRVDAPNNSSECSAFLEKVAQVLLTP